ncbi:hypothetical protein SAMN02787079_01784 [Lysinibacillus sp. TC-37]|jgi:hypothetical protein|nr:hypothetical protein AK833_16990 [Lysinibacillus sp. F5]SCY54814.1 hypothetical protein SAMN02787078_01783 [Lysinibacillus sp. SG9]SDB23577.1 hypothetical protein SAMN02787079_01784 [Lysinibacillus sp. TC-37]SFS70019.1 hypothetical protein SAMN02787087_01564 [Lysinibacillus sp. SG55]
MIPNSPLQSILILMSIGNCTIVQFNKLENGMTKDQVFEILGGEGAVISESGDVVMYSYNGKSLGANASLMFQGSKLMNKTQMVLEYM